MTANHRNSHDTRQLTMLQAQIGGGDTANQRSHSRAPGVSQKVKRFAESLSSLNNNLHGVLKAKSKFLTLRSNQREDVGDEAENIDDLAQIEWDKILARDLSFRIAGFDFSILESIQGSSHPPPHDGPTTPPQSPPPSIPQPPPPPPPPTPQDSGSDSVDSFTNQERKVSVRLGPGLMRMSKFHWSSVRCRPGTIWTELPSLDPFMEDLRDLFSLESKSLPSPITPPAGRKQSVMKLDRIRDVSIIMKGLPQGNILTEAIRDMDEEVLDREQIDKILKLLTFIDEIDQLQKFSKENPDCEASLDRAEKYLLRIGSIPNIEARLSFWKFRLDCEASEEDLCRPVNELMKAIELLRSNQGFKLMLSLILCSGNYLNQTNVTAFRLNDLQKLPLMKDRSKTKSLHYHIVRKALKIVPTFNGFDDTFISAFEAGSRNDLDQVARDLEAMEEECKKSLKFVLMQRNENVDLLNFIKEVVERVITIKKIVNNLNRLFDQFTEWLGLDTDRKPKPNEFCKIIFDFSTETNRLVEDIGMESKRMNEMNERDESHELEAVLKRSLKKMSADEDSLPTTDDGEGIGRTCRKPLREKLENKNTFGKDVSEDANEDELFKVLVSGFKERKTARRKRNKHKIQY